MRRAQRYEDRVMKDEAPTNCVFGLVIQQVESTPRENLLGDRSDTRTECVSVLNREAREVGSARSRLAAIGRDQNRLA
jgi:hypothetical protein